MDRSTQHDEVPQARTALPPERVITAGFEQLLIPSGEKDPEFDEIIRSVAGLAQEPDFDQLLTQAVEEEDRSEAVAEAEVEVEAEVELEPAFEFAAEPVPIGAGFEFLTEQMPVEAGLEAVVDPDVIAEADVIAEPEGSAEPIGAQDPGSEPEPAPDPPELRPLPTLNPLPTPGAHFDPTQSSASDPADPEPPTGEATNDAEDVDDFEDEAGSISMQLAQQTQLPAVDLTEYPVQADAVALVPEQVCRRSRLIPITRMEGRLMVAMVDPSDVVAIDDVSRRTGLTVVPLVADARSVTEAIDRYHRVDSELAELSTTIATEASEFLREMSSIEDGALDGDDDAPIIRFVNLLISQAIMDHASDIHIEPRRSGLFVRYRIDGVLHDVQQASRAMVAGVISRLKVMANLDIAERRRPQDGRISISQAGRSVDLRVATLPTVWGEKIVMRILDTAAGDRSLSDLTMSERNLDVFRESFSKPHGMVLVTGPTGSGKSTTLYTALGEVSTNAVNVITIEDPVEYRMEGVNQVQVNPKAGLTFASALRSILRSDPDVVLLGEIRDRETAQIAIEASLTGHLVLSTLHTNSASAAVTRLVEMGIEPFLVGSAVECVVAQRLARRLCEKCKQPFELDETRLNSLNFAPEGDGEAVFWQPVGCHSCSNTGYAGRLAVHEVLYVDDQIERLAVTEASAGEIEAYALTQGMVTLRQDGLRKAAAGLTSIDEVLRVTA
ncbi:GspE/PulE family protein [Leucobacter soli]